MAIHIKKEHFSALSDLLSSVKGVGASAVAVMVAEVPETDSLLRCEISAFIGVALVYKDAGAMRGRRTVFARRASVRTDLFMSALVGARHNMVIKEFYTRQVAAGFTDCIQIAMNSLMAIGALMRKLVLWHAENWNRF